MSDKALVDLGVVAAGDRVKLRAFCQQENGPKDEKRAEMKRKLTEILEASKSRRTSQSSVKKSKKAPAGLKKVTLKCELCWKHYMKGAGFKTKRSEQGGGVRVLDLPKDATANDCLLELKNTFPNGVSPLGSADKVESHWRISNVRNSTWVIASQLKVIRKKTVSTFPICSSLLAT